MGGAYMFSSMTYKYLHNFSDFVTVRIVFGDVHLKLVVCIALFLPTALSVYRKLKTAHMTQPDAHKCNEAQQV